MWRRMRPEYRLRSIIDSRNLNSISGSEAIGKHPASQSPAARGEKEMARATDTTRTAQAQRGRDHAFVRGVDGVRYHVKDVARPVAVYTTHRGLRLKHQQLPAFGNVSLGDADILLSGPQASGSRPMPNGQQQTPGGWNRVVLCLTDLPALFDTPTSADVRSSHDVEPW